MRIEVPANAVLADRARQLADAAPRGSIERKSAGCAAVALAESQTLASAKKILGLLWSDDVRTAAIQVIHDLATRPED